MTERSHGYSGTPLPRKLGIKPGHAVALINAPAGFAQSLGELPGVELTGVELTGVELTGVELTGLDVAAAFDVIVGFVTWRAELEAEIDELRRRMAPACGLWIVWPKRAAKVPTDMTDHAVRAVALPTGLVDNKICAVDGTWTGLRLVIRRELR